jgi:hypothetical protein
MSETEKITILLQARDKDFAKAMDRNNKLIAKLSSDTTKNTAKMTQSVESSLSSMSSSAATFGKAFIGGLAFGAVTAGFDMLIGNAAATVKGIAEIGDEAKRAGVAVEDFQRWKFVAEQNRIGVDSLTDGFKELSLRADEFVVTGQGSAADAFKRLGYSSAELEAKLKDPSALFLEIIGRLEGLDDAAQIRIADEIFGGTGGEKFVQLLDQGAGKIRETMQAADASGVVMDKQMIEKAEELDRKFNNLKQSSSVFFKSLAVDGAAALVEMADFRVKLEDIFSSPEQAAAYLDKDLAAKLAADRDALDENSVALETNREALDQLGWQADNTAQEIGSIIPYLYDMQQTSAADTLNDLVTEMYALTESFRTGGLGTDEYAEKLEDVRERAETALEQINGINGINLDQSISVVGALGDMLSGLVSRAQAAATAVRAAVNLGSANMDTGTALSGDASALMPPSALAPETSPKPKSAPAMLSEMGVGATSSGSKGGGGGGKSKKTSSVDDLKAEIETLLAEADALNAASLAFDEYGIAQDVAGKKAELLQEAQAAGKKITPELTAEIDALAASYADAAMRAEDAKARHDEFADAMSDMKSTLGDAFVGLTTGAMSFKGALSSIISQLVTMGAQKAFTSLWNGGLGSSTSSLLGGLFGFATGGYTGSGGRNEVAGTVHKGEVVFSQDDVQRAGGVAAVESIRRSGGAVAQSTGGGSTASTDAGSVTVVQSNSFGAGVSRAEVQAMMPKMVEATKAAVLSARKSGGAFGSAFE